MIIRGEYTVVIRVIQVLQSCALPWKSLDRSINVLFSFMVAPLFWLVWVILFVNDSVALGYEGRHTEHDEKGWIHDGYNLLEGITVFYVILEELGWLMRIVRLIHDDSSVMNSNCSYISYTLVRHLRLVKLFLGFFNQTLNAPLNVWLRYSKVHLVTPEDPLNLKGHCTRQNLSKTVSLLADVDGLARRSCCSMSSSTTGQGIRTSMRT